MRYHERWDDTSPSFGNEDSGWSKLDNTIGWELMRFRSVTLEKTEQVIENSMKSRIALQKGSC